MENSIFKLFDTFRDFSVDPGLLANIKTISTVVTAFLSVIFLVILVKLNNLRAPADQGGSSLAQMASDIAPPAPAAGGAYAARWAEVVKHMDTAREAEWKFAIIEADKLVDLVLKRSGFVGDTFGERLMNMQDGQLETLSGLWEAHKLRNRLAHEVDYFLRYTEAKRAIDLFEASLRELEAI